MVRHETPLGIANELARHAPDKIERLLDPAVGTGILLEPFLKVAAKPRYEVFAVERDEKPLNRLSQKFESRCLRLETVADDFLNWARGFRARKLGLFDCIVM